MLVVKKYIVPIVLGIFGMFIGYIVIHLYNDHLNLHALVNSAVRQRLEEQK